jgi:serine protease AprX
MRRVTTVLLVLVGILLTTSHDVQARQKENSKHIIVPGVGVGEYTFGMSKNEIMKKLGEPEHIHFGGEQYTLDNLPRRYYMVFDDIAFCINDDSVTGITALSPSYKFPNGLGVGDSEDKIKQAFGSDFQLGEYGWKNLINYEEKGIQFEIRNKDKTVVEIDVYPVKRYHEEGKNDTSDINRKIAQICTGPADFNDVIKIFGQPSGYDYGGQSFKLEDLPVERYWIRYTDSIHIFMRRDKVEGLEIVDPAYVFNGKIPMDSSLERVLSIVGQPKETVVGERGWEDCVLYKDINGRVGWCQYRREDLNADFRFLNYTLKCIHILEINSSSATAGRAAKRGSFKTVKTIKSVNEFEDVRSKDLSKVDLSSSKGLIATLSFNQQTVWPEQNKMPTGSGPQKILADAMNPGLGIRKLHQQGITGKGVNVAIIDQPLLPDHPEYNGKIVAYNDTGCGPSKSSMHGPAVSSLLVGTNCGTAPNARVYYAAAPSWKADAAYYAKGLDWIIEQNEKLPNREKIRVVSVSAAPSGPGSPFKKNREMWDRACACAEADGIMVLDCTDSHRGFLNRGWYNPGDPESVIQFNPGPPPKREFRVNPAEMSLYVPSSCRTTAQHYDYHGHDSYIYWGRGGLSWSIPYCAGVLAMGWQVRPDLTPAQMKEMLFASAYVQKSGARIINPRGFIEAVKRLR